MTMFARATLLALVALTSATAAAQSVYVGINRTTPGETYADFASARHVENYNNPIAGKLYGGYNLDDSYAIEAGVGMFGTWKIANPAPGSKEEVRISSKMMYLAGKASMPLGERFSLFGKLGIASNKFTMEGTGFSSTSTTSIRPMVGFGVSANATKNLAMVLEYNYYGKVGQTYKQQKLEAGVQYRF